MGKQKITLALSDDVIEIIRRQDRRRMGEFVDACVRVADGRVQPEAGLLERIEELLRKLAEK